MSSADSSVNVLGTGTVPVDTSLGIDATSLTSVYRQRMVIGDDTDFGRLARVDYNDPNPNDMGLIARLGVGSPDLSDIKELLAKLLQVTIESKSPFISDVPLVEKGRQHVITFPPRATPINVSGTITTGSTAQLLFSGNSVRGFDLQNQSASQLLGFSWWTSLPIIGNASTYVLSPGTPGGYYSTPPSLGVFDAISVYIVGPTSGQAFTGCFW